MCDVISQIKQLTLILTGCLLVQNLGNNLVPVGRLADTSISSKFVRNFVFLELEKSTVVI